MFAAAQFESWQAVLLVLILLSGVQFAVGSFVEPRVAGSALSMPPCLVLFSVFFWSYLWGLFGAFIGIPITIAILTVCSHISSCRWVSELFCTANSGRREEETKN